MEKVVTDYLAKLNIPISKRYCKKLILSHPDHPSLLSISDTLQRLGINHQAARLSTDQLMDVEVPYLAQFKEGESLSLVKSKQDLSKHLQKYNGKHSGADHQSAMEHAVVLMAQLTDTILDPENQQHLEAERHQKTVSVVLLSAITGLSLVAALMWFSWWYVALIVTALAGGAVGYLLIGKEIGVTYSPVENFCRAGKRSNCDAVLNSAAARLFGRVSLSDAAAGYFLFQLLVLGLVIPFARVAESFLLPLALLSVLAIPVVFYSFYYQSIRAKTWCRLCLIVDGVLIGQVVLFGYLFSQGLIRPGAVDVLPLLYVVALFFATGSVVLLIKNLLEGNNSTRQAEVAANRLKYSPEVFSHLLSQSKRADTTPFEHEILLGSRDAPINITMAANLYCHPCKVGFEKVGQLLAAYPDKVNFAIRLLRSGRGGNGQPSASRYILARWLHRIYGKPDELSNTKKLFLDWYEFMDITVFMKNYPVDDHEDPFAGHIETRHIEWMEQEKINKTPTWFINGYELPDAYDIADLMGMVPGLAENFTSVMRKERSSTEIL